MSATNTTATPVRSRAAIVWRRIYRGTLMVLTFIICLGLIIASFGGHLNPSSYPGACIMVMLFPAWLAAWVLISLLDLIWCRKALVIAVLSLLACIHAVWDFTPLNIFSRQPAEGNTTFTLLSFNVENFSSMSQQYPDGTNPALSHILATDADIVCLQEAPPLSSSNWGRVRFAQAQIDSIYARYPYIFASGGDQMIFSKFPTEAIHTGSASRYNRIALAHVKINGQIFTVINVHLQSYNLTGSDKQLYQGITSPNIDSLSLRNDFSSVKSQLLSKIQRAAERRANEAERVVNYINRFGGPNVIVTGDFNDVPGCYTIHRLADADLSQVYSEVATGPAITYYANSFYFRIDHTMYRGNLRPLSLDIGGSHASDHLPVLTRFEILP